MSKILTKRDSNVNKKLSKRDIIIWGWDKAILDAKKGIGRLESAIEIFEARKAAGEPWPGGDAGTDKSIPA